MRRTINRVAALLELVDIELDRVSYEKEQYQKEIASGESIEDLNSDVLRNILYRELPNEYRTEYDEGYLAQILDECETFGVKNSSTLKQLIQKNLDAALAADKRAVDDLKAKGRESKFKYEENRLAKGIFYNQIGLMRQCFEEEFGQKYVDYITKKKSPT
jgi:transposase